MGRSACLDERRFARCRRVGDDSVFQFDGTCAASPGWALGGRCFQNRLGLGSCGGPPPLPRGEGSFE